MRNKQLITFLYSGCETNPEWDCIFIEKDCSYPRSTPSESYVSHPIAFL